MKKLIILILIVAALAGAGYWWFGQQQAATTIGDILPHDALAYVRVNDSAKNMEKISNLKFWQGINNINFQLLVEQGVMEQQALTFINLIREQVTDVINNPLAKKFFGRDWALAVYEPKIDFNAVGQGLNVLNPKLIEDILSGLFLVTRVDPEIKFAEFASRFFGKYGTNVVREEEEYNGHLIHKIIVAPIGMSFGAVRFDDLIVIGVGTKAAHKSVDVYNGEVPPLSSNSRFTQVLDRALDPAHLIGYLNFETVTNMIVSQGAPFIQAVTDPQARAQWDDVVARMAGLKTFGFSTQLASVLRIDSYFFFDPASVHPDYRSLYTCAPGRNASIGFTPGDVLGYQWSNCFELDQYWDQIKKEINKAGTQTTWIQEIEQNVGFSIENDLLPAFGGEVGGYLKDIKIGGIFPIPEFLLFIKVKDRSKVDRLLSILQQQPVMTLQEENYQGSVIKYLAVPFGENLQPGYAYFGDFLLAASGRQLIKASIDAAGNAALALPSDQAFKSVNYGLTGSNRSVQFFRVASFMDKIRGLLQWSNSWASAQEKKTQAFQAGSAKPLEEAVATIAAKGAELDEMNEQLNFIEDLIWNLETKSLDTSAKQAEYDELESQIATVESEIAAAEERRDELAAIVDDMESKIPDADTRQLILHEAVSPVLDSLKSIRAVGAKATVSENVFETSVFLNVN